MAHEGMSAANSESFPTSVTVTRELGGTETEKKQQTQPSMGMEFGSRSHGEPTSSGYTAYGPIITVGICAMNKKTMAQPMKNILSRLAKESAIDLVMFTDHTILYEPIEDWPICDSLIAFYSNGFPLEKAIEYVKLREPLVLNDLQSQYALMDRRKVYEILMKNGVEVPRHMVVNRGEDSDHTDGRAEPQVVETDDLLEINGIAFHKPFVEKPIDAENHNIYIYFPSDYGGGSQRLFRKVKDRSSTYSKVSAIRTKGSFIYEEFMPTDGTDVKVYTVGPDYAHAEARKSPALDGKVERDENGKEIRYPVLLTAQEKLIARKVCLAFKQIVCGFDLLRANGKSYVCDVNGFSFVKNSQKYYDDCAQILRETIIGKIAPYYFPLMPPSVEYLAEEVPDLPVPIPVTNNQFELRCVIGVIRHGDRTPKQKMKMIVKHRRFFELFETFSGYDKGELKLKKPKQLQMVLDISRDLLDEIEQGSDDEHEVEEKVHKLKQLKTVLEMYGTFSGINRKVQLKLITRKQGEPCRVLLLILKWGGELTPAGKKQAEEYGRTFRCMYPGGEGEYSSLPGSGFLRLHSTYRHDLKVYASDEGRVQMTAAAFTKGLLDLEGSLASVLVHLVKRDQAATNMLDTFTDAQDAMNSVKERLHEMMRSEDDFSEESYSELAPPQAESIVEAMHRVKNPHKMCVQLHQKISELLTELREIARTTPYLHLYQDDTLDIMIKRWAKLEKDFRHKKGHFDISKIPDIYDCIKYDLLHNSELNLKNAKELFNCVMPMADIVIPQEYGITVEEKLDIAKKICSPLLRKIQNDLHHTIINEQGDFIHRLDPLRSKGVVSPNRHVRTRLYFTSESHVHSLYSILKYNGVAKNPELDPRWKEAMDTIRKAPELNYMTQIVFMLFEDVNKPEDSLDKYHVDIHFSPGIKGRAELSAIDSSSAALLLKKSSPELPEKSPQFFVKRLSHASPMVAGSSSESGGTSCAAAGSSTAINRTRCTGDSLSTGALPTATTTIHGGDFFRRYVTSSRSTAAATMSSGGSSMLSPKDVLGRRRDSAPNPLRSLSDTKLVDRASKKEKQLKEEKAECNGNGESHRKKSASESILESMQEPTFGIGSPSAHRSKSDGDMTEDESPKLWRTSSSSPDLNKGCMRSSGTSAQTSSSLSEKLVEEGSSTMKVPVKKLSAPSIAYRYVAKPADPSGPTPSLPTKKPQKLSAPLILSSPLEEQRAFSSTASSTASSTTSSNSSCLCTDAVLLPSSTAQKQSFPSISKQAASDGSGSVKKWGSIEQLQGVQESQSGFTNEKGKDSQWSMVERGVEMASELATQIEPLIHIASMSLRDTDAFLSNLTGLKLNYREGSSKEMPRPHSAVIHRRSSSEEPSRKRSPASTVASELPSSGGQHRHYRFCAGSTSPEEESSTQSRATPPSTNHLTTCNIMTSDSVTSRMGHRNSVGSIDTETFGKRNCDHHLCVHHHQLSGYHTSPFVMDSSYTEQHVECNIEVNRSSTGCWSRGIDSSSTSNSGSVNILPGLSCDSLNVTDSSYTQAPRSS